MKSSKEPPSAIKASGLSKNYGAVQAVTGLSLEVRCGEIYGFLGRNGAGKTTTIRMLLGLARPSGGTVTIFGLPLAREREAILGRVGYLVEGAAAYPNLTVRENLELQRRMTLVPAESAPASGLYGFPFGVARTEHPSRMAIEEVISLFKLGEFADRRAGSLSLGNKQRLSLARTLIHSPELLILDEPVNGLDPAGIVEIRQLLRRLADERGVTIFMSSHLLDEVEQLADRVGIIHEGRLVGELDKAELRTSGTFVIEIAAEDVFAAKEALARAGIRPRRAGHAIMDLEQHFLRLTGEAR